MKNRNLTLHVIFGIIVLVELISRWFENHSLEYGVKPFIMIWIAVYFILNNKQKPINKLLLLAFVFSWTGDMFLMLSHQNETFFYAGVGGFFFAQLFYIITFLKRNESNTKGILARKPFLILIFLAFLILMLWYLYDGLEGIMIPIIIVYGISLLGMSAAAFNRFGRTSKSSFLLVFYGSIAFVISDSLIAISKFQTEIPKASFIIITTYILAQYMIMRGMLAKK